MRYLLVLLFCSCCLMAVPALAQSDQPPEEEPPVVRYKAETEIDFGERRVDGTIAAPMGYFGMSGLPDRPTKPLVTLKANFNPEMNASVSAIR
jgi:hypothetical protein